jgi:hypothetical protein
MPKRAFGLLIAITMGTVDCGSSGSTLQPPSTSQAPATSASGAPTEPILGTWRMEYTCEELVRAYKQYGLADQLPVALAAFDVHKSSTDQRLGRICAGAKHFQRTHYFRPNGYLINYQGKQIVDDCHCYQLVDNHTFVLLGDPGDPDVSLLYRLDGDTLTFDVVKADQCESSKCRGQVAFAIYQYALGPWQRVN